MFVYLFLALALVLLVLLVLVICGRLLVRNQRKVLEALRQNGLAFLCRPTLGMRNFAGFVLSVDHDTVSLWKVGLGQPVRMRALPRHGATVAPATVRINVARSSPGLSVVSSAGERVDVVIYPDPTMSYSTPTKGAPLDLAYAEIRENLASR